MPSTLRRFVFLLTLSLMVLVASRAPAQTSSPSTDQSVSTAPSGTTEPPAKAIPWEPGPRTITLGHALTLALPEGYLFLGMPHAAQLLAKMGSFHSSDLLGLVIPDTENDWFISVRYEDSGYIKDDETIDAKELLESIRQGTEEANKERVEKGFKPLRIDGWSQDPAYDRAKHHLVWGLTVATDDGKSINYNTRVLGRRGFVSLNLVTSPETAMQYRPEATKVLGATTFDVGARYEDFDSKIDKVAEFGLTGLILGGAGLGAAKLVKLGFFAKFWNVILGGLLVMKKGIIFVLAGLGALLKRLFGGKKTDDA